MKQTMKKDLRRQIGQLLFFGFDGTRLNEHALHAIREKHIGNVILFARNFESAAQLKALISELQGEAMEACGLPLFVAIDHEGGSVNRLTGDFTWFPGPMAIRAAGPPSLAFETGLASGLELSACGINLNLAPVVDLADNPDSAHIGSRSFGASPEEIAPYAAAYLQGLQRYVLATAKHFPSIGGSPVDLHLELGRNTHTIEELEAGELAPVRDAVKAGVRAVMTSHEIYPALDDCPGTLSPILIRDYLRLRYAFQGLVISDCMEMKALCNAVSTPEACVRAFLAGVDMMLVCHTRQVQDDACDALLEAVESGRIPEERLAESLERITKVKKEQIAKGAAACNGICQKRAQDLGQFCQEQPQDLGQLCQKQPQDLGQFCQEQPQDLGQLYADHRRLSSRICEAALTVKGDAGFFIPEKEERFLWISPPPAALTILEEAGGPAHLGSAVKTAFPAASCLSYHFPMTEEELEAIRREAASGGYTKIYFALFQAHQDGLQRQALECLFRQKAPVGVIALRSPYDLRWCKGHASLVLYDYTPPMTAALLKFMKGEINADGKLPVTIPGPIPK